MKRIITLLLCAVTVIVMTACGQQNKNAQAVTDLPKPDMAKWQYDADNDIYYQTGIFYCEAPADQTYEKLAIFIPGAYMDASDNGDGTYTCTVNAKAKAGGYTAQKAPIMMPIETEGYASRRALPADFVDSYAGYINLIARYTDRGYVYVHAGCRGVFEGAPTGVTDLKAAIRYIRYCDDVIAGDAESIFVYGMSGGGAQAAVLGASGDSALYDPYLEAIGAVQGVSDAVKGSMDWCPVTDLVTANAEYEWMMGCTRPEREEIWNTISDRLAQAYAEYVNNAGFVDEKGDLLTLEKSDEGIYQAGTYYDYIKGVIDESLNNYLSDSGFDDQAAQAYIDSMNKDKVWITYDKSAQKASVTSVADYVRTCKKATDLPVAFDQPPGANTLFGYGDGEGSHFDRILTEILTDLGSEYAADYEADLKKTDAFGSSVAQRVDMYAPLYYLMESREGFGTSKVAPYWRIRSGIDQTTNALTTEVNLALALKAYDGVKDVDFATVWAQGHEPVDRTGDPVVNFMDWADQCMGG